MINANSVKQKFLVVSGLEEADAQIEALCSCSALKYDGMLRDSTLATDERVIFAAACDAYYQWVLIGCSAAEEAYKSVKAGDITVNSDSRAVLEAAKQIKACALEALEPLFADNGFYFTEVEINDC